MTYDKCKEGNNVQKKILAKSILSVLVIASPLAGAVTYPPAFEPSVVYQDKEYIGKQAPAATAPAPAAAAPAKPAAADHTKYPEEFKPEVVYRDPSAISKTPSSAGSSSASDSKPSVSTSSAPAASSTATGETGGMSDNLPLFGIVAAIAAGLFFFAKRGGKQAAAPAEAVADTSAATQYVIPGETGVARYLRTVTGGSETGVAKYLKNLPGAALAAAETGVAKYLKNLPSVSASAETGVAKYLKNMDSSAG
jgi:hypothetical protein